MIEGEISGLVPNWKAEHMKFFQEDDYGHDRPISHASPPSPPPSSSSSSIMSHRMDDKCQNTSHWNHDEQHPELQKQLSSEDIHTHTTRFYLGGNPNTMQSHSKPCCNGSIEPERSSSHKNIKDMANLTRDRSLVDTESIVA